MKFSLLLFLLAAATALAVDAAQLPAPADRSVDFAKDIQPIFEAKCVKCHGAEKQKGGYRLDQRESALHGGDDHAPNIHPEKSAESPLIQFVAGLDPELKMPAKGDPLTAEEIGLLRAWIDQGAVWPEATGVAKKDPLDWWSLKPLVRPPVPTVAGGKSNPVDAFIRARLAEKKLEPSPDADARTIIRRMSYDLTGLPPTPEEVEAFVAESVNAWQAAIDRLADRLLASPRYGERWARHWLDVVHYGDTHGYDKDKPRPHAWPYRDYVIRAFNEDKPYAQFVQEQIAGDVLFPGRDDGQEALGFISAGPWDFIGHAEQSEAKLDGKIARLLDRDDMVANTMNTFCAMTVQCARCHNHKFDPVKQEDYYRLQAVFAALDRADKQYDLDPAVAEQRRALTMQRAALEAQKKALEDRRGAVGGDKTQLLEKLIADLKLGLQAVERPEFGFHSKIAAKPDEAKWVQIDLGGAPPLARVLYVGCHDNFNGIGAGFGFPVRYKIELSDDPTFANGVTVLEDQTQADVPNPGVRPMSINAAGKSGRFLRFTATRLASRSNDYILALAEIQALDAAGRNVALGAPVTSSDSTDVPPRWSRQNLVDGYYYGHKAEASPERIAALEQERAAVSESSPPDPSREELAAIQKKLTALAVDLGKLPAPKTVYAGTVHTGTGSFTGTGAAGGLPRPIFVLKRGDVRQPAEPVGPGTVPISRELPSQFPETDGQPESARRAALAKWITDEHNPLTWRVIVNRVWQYHFGRGLVDSPNDFGRMGQQPTHSALLDWLAVEFRDGGGSLKKLHRLLVTSATYRQSSSAHEAVCPCDSGEADAPPPAALPGVASDSDNSLLWRMNRRKLDAEAMHDSVLAVAGKLDLTMGGPGFKDFVVEHPEHSPHYEYARHDIEDPKTHRRSIYRFIVRSQPQPLMTVLDCADPSVSVDKRNESLNALQALAIRNNRLTVAMGRHFGERVAQIAPEPEAQIAAAYRLALQRAATPEESTALTAFVNEHGLANACRLIFSLNEFAFVD